MLFLLSYKIILSNDTRSNTVVLFCECSEWMLVFNAKRTFVLSWREQGTFRWLNDNIHFVLDQHSYLDFYSAGTQQQSAGGYVAPFGHIIVISSQPVFALTPYWCMLSVEATNTNFSYLDWYDRGSNSHINPTWGEHVNLYECKQYNIMVSYTESQWISVKYLDFF